MNIGEFIDQIEQQRKEQDAIYHNVAVAYGLSDTAMWVLYFVSNSKEVCTQHNLCQQSYYAKQTINTAITNLVKNGYVDLELIPGTRNHKKILLTPKGWELAKNTTDHLREAELRAYGRMNESELREYLEMTTRLTMFLREETDKIIK